MALVGGKIQIRTIYHLRRRDGNEEEVIFNRNGLAMKVAGPFLLKRKVYDYCCAISINKNH